MADTKRSGSHRTPQPLPEAPGSETLQRPSKYTVILEHSNILPVSIELSIRHCTRSNGYEA
jgi:hypothetical protein